MLGTLITIILIPILLIIPGYLLYVRRLLTKETRDERNFAQDLFFVVFTSFLVTTLTGTLLSLIGAFSLAMVSLLNLIVSVALYFLVGEGKLSINFLAYKVKWQDVLLFNLLLICIFIYFHPAEDIFGGMDGGIYVNTGINLAKNGNIFFEDPVMQELPASIRKQIPEIFQVDGYGLYFKNTQKTKLIGQFLPAYPVWLALAYSLFGLNGFLHITPFIAILGLYAVYLVGKTLFSRTAGLIGASFLAFNILYVWFAREPLSEIMSNTILFGGLYYFSRFKTEKIDTYALISGLAFGTSLFVRMDSFLIAAPLLAALLYFRFKEDRKTGQFILFGSFAAFLPIVTLAAILFYDNYIHLLILYFLNIDLTSKNGALSAELFRTNHILKVIVLICAFALFFLLYKKANEIKKYFSRFKINRLFLLTGVTGLLCSATFYQLFLRPSLPFRFMSPQANSLKRLGWYLLPISSFDSGAQPVYNMEFGFLADVAITLLAAAVIFAFYKIKNFNHIFAFGLFLSYTIIYLSNLRMVPIHFWLNRRFINIILPFAFLCAGFVLSLLLRKNQKKLTKIAGVLIVLVVLSIFISGSTMIIKHNELKKAIVHTEKVASWMDSDSLYIMDANSSSLYHLVSLPLKNIFDKKVLLYKESPEHNARLVKILPQLASYFNAIYFCANSRSLLPKLPYHVAQEGWNEILVRKFEQTDNLDFRPPSNVEDLRIRILTYRLDDRNGFHEGERQLDFGTSNEWFLLDGFYNSEQNEHETYRWTTKKFSVLLPPLMGGAGFKVRMSGGRPPQLASPSVSFYLNGKKVGDFSVFSSFQEYSFEVSYEKIKIEKDKPLILMGISETWMPKAAGVNVDVRELGIMIDKITIIEKPVKEHNVEQK